MGGLAYSKDNYKQAYREIGHLKILFYGKESVYIKDDRYFGITIVHRWGDIARGRWKTSWKPFMDALKYGKKIEGIFDVIKLANWYNLGVVGSTRNLPETPKNIKVYK